MTEKQLKQFEELLDVFQLRCEEICNLLIPINDSYRYLYKFEVDGDEIWGEGDEYWGYGGHEYHSSKFPKSFLTAPNSKIQEYVDGVINKRKEEKLAREKRHMETLEKMERRQLEALKKKYGE